MTLLLAVLLLPLVGMLIVAAMPKTATASIRTIAVAVSGLTFLLSLGLAGPFIQGARGFQFETNTPWVGSPAIGFHLALDGMSVWLVLLSTLLTPLVMLVSWHEIRHRVKEFFALLLLLEFSLVGVFSALDLFLFYVFFEMTLLPAIFLIGIYGGDRRVYAATKFFLYTLAGSLLMLGAIIYLYNHDGSGTFDLVALGSALQGGRLVLTRPEALALFLGFFIAFAIKLALFPFHSWLPDAYTEAPTAGTTMLAAVMTKMGTYGLIRFCLPLFPNAARQCAPWIIVLAIIGILYGALIALVQPNIKRLIAYSSISHIGFIVLGIFSFTPYGVDGAVFQMVAHGISTGALFLLCGMLYERRGALEIGEFGGAATSAPVLASLFAVSMLASIGLPSLCNFVGEYLTLQGIAQVQMRYAVFAAIGVILSACYMLWMYQRTFLGQPAVSLPDLTTREVALLTPLVLMMVWLGVGAQTFLPSIGIATARILDQAKVGVEFQVQAPVPSTPEVAHAR